jgi:hypothetical protein
MRTLVISDLHLGTVTRRDLLRSPAPREALAERIWAEIVTLTGLPRNLPPWQIVKEKRATFAATPDGEAKRPPAQTRFHNLVLAGDWTATGLPATIEGSVRSGYAAALVLEAIAAGRVPAAA